ncbi:MAG TPA: DUF1501 domain-containing protein [Kutzneria sp.]|nr:DUF1501 domain-containing protein [Kutzneria sp.]
MKISRRGFILASGVVGAGALAAGATQVDWTDLIAAATRDPRSPDAGVLVVCTLYGGNDGLNTVIPAADAAYQKARPDLAYQPHEVLDLGDGLGLNPGMKGLKKLWDDKRLAVVRGVGYPKPDHSHFRSMAIWQTASPDSPQPTGWLGRWLDVTGDDPLRAVSIEPVLPPLMAGQRAAGATLPVTGLKLPNGAVGKAFELLGQPQAGESADRARVARSIADLHTTATKLGPAVKPSSGNKGQLAAQLDVVAGLVEAGVPTRAYSVSLGGFDTHADEKGTQQRLLTELDQALSAFVDRVRGKKVVVLVYSEFGRRVGANASDGTDHGTAGPVFVIGDNVNGGFYGEQPSLTDLDNGDLKESTDFRDVYATMLRDVLGADPAQVLAGHTTTLSGLLA